MQLKRAPRTGWAFRSATWRTGSIKEQLFPPWLHYNAIFTSYINNNGRSCKMPNRVSVDCKLTAFCMERRVDMCSGMHIRFKSEGNITNFVGEYIANYGRHFFARENRHSMFQCMREIDRGSPNPVILAAVP